MNWTSCYQCAKRGPILNCALCEVQNGRPMTKDEEDALLMKAQKAWEAANPGWEKKVPYAD